MSQQPCIFISHKHEDKKIADIIRKFLDQESRKEIRVYQSSNSNAQGPRLGNTITSELKQELWDSGVVLLIYTTEDKDWSYCMWECGVATKQGIPQTRIIVLQCAKDTPKVFKDQVHVDMHSKDDIFKLVQSFLTQTDFFPGGDKALAPNLSSDGPEIMEKADDLYEKLKDEIHEHVSEEHVQPFIQLELKIDKKAKITSDTATLTEFGKSLQVSDINSRAQQIFGALNAKSCKTFETLVKRLAEGNADESPAWVKDLQGQIVNATRYEFPVPCGSLLEDGTEHYMPVLTHYREGPADMLQFDVNLVPLETDKVLSGIGDPYIQEYQNAKKKVKEFAPSLYDYFTPIATRYFSDWSEYVRKVANDGVEMRSREKLEITQLLVDATKEHTLIERKVGDPQKIHNFDWHLFYDKLGKNTEVNKVWILCVEEEEARNKVNEVEAAWRFFKDKKFRTLYCSPQNVECAMDCSIDEVVNERDVIENFGEYMKLVSLPERSFIAAMKANALVITFRKANNKDRNLLKSLDECSTEMTEDWLNSLRTPR